MFGKKAPKPGTTRVITFAPPKPRPTFVPVPVRVRVK